MNRGKDVVPDEKNIWHGVDPDEPKPVGINAVMVLCDMGKILDKYKSGTIDKREALINLWKKYKELVCMGYHL